MTTAEAILILVDDPALSVHVDRVVAAADLQIVRAADPSSRRVWSGAAAVLLDAAAARRCAERGLPRRARVLLISGVAAGAAEWEAAVAVGAQQVVMLPTDEAELMALLADAAEASRDGADRGPVVAVIGGRGGAGASVFATALAREAAESLLVEADPWAGGLDLVLGSETEAGLRWPDLALAGGRLTYDALREALPSRHGVRLLAGSRVLAGQRSSNDIDPAPLAAVLDAGSRGGVTVVCDVARCPTAATETAVAAADLVVLVTPADIRSCAAAAATGQWVSGGNPNTGVVVRGPAPGGLRPLGCGPDRRTAGAGGHATAGRNRRRHSNAAGCVCRRALRWPPLPARCWQCSARNRASTTRRSGRHERRTARPGAGATRRAGGATAAQRRRRGDPGRIRWHPRRHRSATQPAGVADRTGRGRNPGTVAVRPGHHRRARHGARRRLGRRRDRFAPHPGSLRRRRRGPATRAAARAQRGPPARRGPTLGRRAPRRSGAGHARHTTDRPVACRPAADRRGRHLPVAAGAPAGHAGAGRADRRRAPSTPKRARCCTTSSRPGWRSWCPGVPAPARRLCWPRCSALCPPANGSCASRTPPNSRPGIRTWSGSSRGAPTSRASARSPCAIWSSRRYGCGRTESSSARYAAPKSSTCSRR